MNKRLSARRIRKSISADIDNIVVFDSIDSTNSYAKNYVLQNAPLPAMILAEEQTAGRGRLGRTFYSPSKTGLYMSIAYIPTGSPEDSLFTTVAASVACAKAIEELTERRVQIKWVNDIYIDGKKAGGILCESVFENGKMGIIVGIGVNVSTSEFPEFDNNTPTATGALDRNALAGKIYDYFVKFNSREHLTPCLDEYRERFYLQDKNITIHYANGESENAIARSIDERGGLIAELDGGEITIIRSGEVTVRET